VRKSRPNTRHAKTRLLRQIAMALCSLLLAFAIVSGLARAHGRYFYCEAMGLLATDPCAAAAASSDGDEDVGRNAEARRSDADCCEHVVIPPAPESTTVGTRAVPPPALVAILAPMSSRGERPAPAPGRPNGSLQRWRVPPRYAGELRAQLMVFLT
jgi:hypothetical protein